MNFGARGPCNYGAIKIQSDYVQPTYFHIWATSLPSHLLIKLKLLRLIVIVSDEWTEIISLRSLLLLKESLLPWIGIALCSYLDVLYCVLNYMHADHMHVHFIASRWSLINAHFRNNGNRCWFILMTARYGGWGGIQWSILIYFKLSKLDHFQSCIFMNQSLSIL